MKQITGLAVATAAFLAGSLPALADDIRLGQVDVDFLTDNHAQYSGFGGPVETLIFAPDRGDVFCKEITITYADGRTDTVVTYKRLKENKPLRIDVPGRAKRVDAIDFVCHSYARGVGIRIGAEVGRYRDSWRHDRDWQNRWAGMFGGDIPPPPDRRDERRDERRGDRPDWVPPPPPDRGDRRDGPPDWIVMDRLSFEGSNDKEQTFGGWRGRNVDTMALRAVNHSARCNQVKVTFRNGDTVSLAKNRKLHENEVAVFDLPGYRRDIDSLFMRCHAMGDGQVTIEVLVHK